MHDNTLKQAGLDASFHDIGKIVDWDAVGLRGITSKGRLEKDPHEFQKCVGEDGNSTEWGIDTAAVPWQSVLTRLKTWPGRHPGSMHRWHTRTADWLSAGYGRGFDKRNVAGESVWGVHCLWTGKQQTDQRLKTKEQLRELIAFLNGSPTWAATVETYGDRLRARAEEASPGLNVTSVLAHSTTTGKLARVLVRSAWTGVDAAARPTPKAIRSLREPPRLIAAHYRLDFRQRPFRARDLGVFARMELELTRVIESFPDNVLSRLGFECVAVFESADTRHRFLQTLEDSGFTIREQSVESSLAEYLPEEEEAAGNKDMVRGLMTMLEAPWGAVYAQPPPPRLDLPICEGCQMAQASRHWPKDHLAAMDGWSESTRQRLEALAWRDIDLAEIPEQDRRKLRSWLDEWGEEDLCDDCYRIRQETEPVPLLRDWDGQVLYARISLDLNRLAGHTKGVADEKQKSALEFLHKEHLRSLNPGIDQAVLDRLFVSFPMVVDFVDDYLDFLQGLWQAIETRFAGRLARLASDVACLGIDKRSEVIETISIVERCFRAAFPKFLELPDELQNPIGIAMSISKKKHPFFDHWRLLAKPEPDFSVQVVDSGCARFRLRDHECIMQALDQPKRSQLHSLAAAANISEALGKVMLRERDSRGGLVLARLNALVPDSLDLESARILANLMED